MWFLMLEASPRRVWGSTTRGSRPLEGNLLRCPVTTNFQLGAFVLCEGDVTHSQGTSLTRAHSVFSYGAHEGVHRAIGTHVPTYPLEQRSNLLHGEQPFFIHDIERHRSVLLRELTQAPRGDPRDKFNGLRNHRFG